MAIYTYRCKICLDETEEFYNYSARPSSLLCSLCKGTKVVVPSVPRLDFNLGYYKQLEKEGKVVLEKGMDKDAKSNREARLAKEDKKRREYVIEKVREFPFRASDTITGDSGDPVSYKGSDSTLKNVEVPEC